MTPSHGVRHDREKGSGRLGYLPLASAIRVKQRELSLKRLGPCWDAPRSQGTLPACDDDSQSSRRRCPFRGSGGSAPAAQGALSLALDAPDGWRAAAVWDGMPLWLSLESGRPWSMQGTNLFQHGIHASGLAMAICRRQPTNLVVVCPVSHSAARSMPDGCHWDNFFTFSLGSGHGAARQLPVFPPSSTP